MESADDGVAGDYAEQIYTAHPPRDILKPFVRRVMVADTCRPEGIVVRAASTGYNYVGWQASGCSRVLVDGVPTDYGKFHFAGQLRGQQVEVIHSGYLIHILAEFTATGLMRLIHVPGAAIFGRPLPVADLDPACARALSVLENVETNTVQAKAAAFQDVLCDLVDGAAPPIDYLEKAVAMIEDTGGLVRIADICQTLGVSQRHLARTFTEVVGIGPKYFAKVVQLNTALGALLSGDHGQVSKVSHEFGYSDQAHFVHVMQELLRMGPTAFLESKDDVLATFLAQSQAGRRPAH